MRGICEDNINTRSRDVIIEWPSGRLKKQRSNDEANISGNSHDSQIPIGIAASGSRAWQAEQKLTHTAHCKLSQGAVEKNHVSYGYDWMSTNMIGQDPSTLPVFSQWQHAGHVPPDHPSIKRSEICHTWYIGHASSQFPEIMHCWKLRILFLSNVPHKNCSMLTEPSNHHTMS